ncbi:erythromycin esterase family protein [Sinomicrobium pectinilyticum]|uniref:Erythromycin esterase family protein n=1 Tax=Sinomicrobium pectinilyticum TaxID=1084421 RepID=A0A3N0DHQ4_SINP1|nr:erythromycin esterase family protein [Sinomicrobium pectinilyticum]RNL75219.1 erythromycin esterase family protein [Sinomicrobium pectinilyticum]
MKTTLLCLFLCLAKASFSQEFLNLDFEYEVRGSEIPKKWYIESPGYIAKMDETEKYSSERSLKMTSNSPVENHIAVFTGNFPVTLAKGRSIEFTGHVKTESVTNGYAGLWWSVDGEAGVLAFDNMEEGGLRGTNDWQEVSIRMNVDKNATDVSFGGLLTGLGTAWFDDFEIRIDGKEFEDLQPRVSAPTMEELEWLKNNVYPLSTYDPAKKSDEDLEIMDSLIGDTHVVGLGEVTHGSSEIFQMKHRIIKFLAEKKNFGIFSMEVNMPEAYRLNDYIISGKGNPTELIKGMDYWTWSTREVLNMVEWMKLHNASKQQIQFTGFDMQSYDLSIQELEKKFKNNPTTLDDLIAIKQLLDKTSNQHMGSRLGAISQEDKDTIEVKISRIRDAIKKLKITGDRMPWLYQNIRIIEQYVDKTIFSRDKFMAENLMWIRSQNPGSKIVIWAHNAHIQRTMRGMGNFLSDSLAKDYLSVGFAFARGTYTAMGSQGLTEYQAEEPYNGTFEKFFEAIDAPIFIIDLRSVKAQKPTFGKWLLEKLDFRQVGVMKPEREFYETNLSEDYDLIIFIRDSSGSKLLD